jgi:hypothetical protein
VKVVVLTVATLTPPAVNTKVLVPVYWILLLPVLSNQRLATCSVDILRESLIICGGDCQVVFSYQLHDVLVV